MAKIAKNQMKVKGVKETYTCTWEFLTPVEEWSKETLLANIRAGIRYAISRTITLSVLADEQNMGKNKLKIEKVQTKYADKPEMLADMLEFLRDEGVRTEIKTHFKFAESDFSAEPVDDEEDTTGVTEKVEAATTEEK